MGLWKRSWIRFWSLFEEGWVLGRRKYFEEVLFFIYSCVEWGVRIRAGGAGGERVGRMGSFSFFCFRKRLYWRLYKGLVFCILFLFV